MNISNLSPSFYFQNIILPSLFPKTLELTPAAALALATFSRLKVPQVSQSVLHNIHQPIAPTLFPDHLTLTPATAAALAEFSKSSLSKVKNEKPQETILVEDILTDEKIECVKMELEDGTFTYARELAPVITAILNSETAYSLLKQALKDGPLTFLDTDSQTAPRGGIFIPERRYIYIDRTESANRRLGHTLFEICDALSHELTKDLRRKALSGDVPKETYVQTWEKAQYQSLKTFTKTISSIIDKDYWSEETNLNFPNEFADFSDWPTFWKSIRSTKHAIHYRLDWKKKYKKIYCGKHPGKNDCREGQKVRP